VAFGDPPPCDQCRERAMVRIVTIVFDGPSPPDQFLCRVHAPTDEASVAGESRAGTGLNGPGPRTREPHPGRNEPTHPKGPSIEDRPLLCR
jgi:hypothetical protein